MKRSLYMKLVDSWAWHENPYNRAVDELIYSVLTNLALWVKD